MLSLKVYNSLPYTKRRHLARIVFRYMSDEFIEDMAQPFHHNFNYDGGHWYKLMLDHCTLDKEKENIKVTITIPVKH